VNTPRWHVLIAPGGYGKTHWLAQQAATFAGNHCRLTGTEALATVLAPWLPPGAQSLTERLHALEVPLLLQIDQAETCAAETLAHLQALLADPPPRLWLTLASRCELPLSLAPACAAGWLRYLDAESLRLSLSDVQALWVQAGLSWESEDLTCWQQHEGWPPGCLLWLRHRLGALSASAYQTLCDQAIDDLFRGLPYDWQELLNPEHHAALRARGLAPEQWLPLWRKRLFGHLLLSARSWLLRALQPQLSARESQTLLERGLALCQPAEAPLRLSILTRLAHLASLEARWADLDALLREAEPLLPAGYQVDQAAWLYQQANRARQRCRYAESEALLKRLWALRADGATALNLQVRGYLLQGLNAFQQGDYIRTQRAYEQARVLAEADQNAQMQLEIKILLAFLAALQGQEAQIPEDILDRVAAQPLAAQPMMWLNLTLLRILGESQDLRQGHEILERVRSSSQQLNWPFMLPLIADVEARLLRFHQHDEQALRLHEQALEQLEPGSFEALNARLNLALTCSRQGDSPRATELLRAVLTEASASGSLGLAREARSALQALEPEHQTALPAPPRTVLGHAEPLLNIRMLGSFQLVVEGHPVMHWPRKKARHLLIHLLFHPHGMHRETLADWLSGHDELEQALRQLDVHIHALRRVLEPERKGKQASRYIQFHDACYSFNFDCAYDWDYQAFHGAAGQWLSWREADPAAAAQAAVRALALYQGPLLPELDFADHWLAEREGLERKVTDLMQWTVPWLCQQGQPEQAEEIANRLLSLDACSESGFRALLQVAGHYRHFSRLQRIGHQMEEAFARHWESPPPPELQQLYASLKNTISAG
jgi:DNA-binding SARP family transcriptional activator